TAPIMAPFSRRIEEDSGDRVRRLLGAPQRGRGRGGRAGRGPPPSHRRAVAAARRRHRATARAPGGARIRRQPADHGARGGRSGRLRAEPVAGVARARAPGPARRAPPPTPVRGPPHARPAPLASPRGLVYAAPAHAEPETRP